MTDAPEKPSPSTAALRQGLSRCRVAYPRGPWPALNQPELWRRWMERWQSGCYGMTDEVFLQAVEDHCRGPNRHFTACPGHLWVAVDLRREAGEGPLPAPKQTVILDRQARITEHMEEIRKQLGGGKTE